MIGEVEIGMNSTLLHDAEIGSYCIIAAGCLIREKMIIPDHSFVVGLPGEIESKVSEDQQWWIKESPFIYSRLSKQYKLEGL